MGRTKSRISNAGLLYEVKGRALQHGIENPWQREVASVRLQKAGQLLENQLSHRVSLTPMVLAVGV